MNDLIGFLREQHDADERVARDCSGDGMWTEELIAQAAPEPGLGPEPRRHIARWDPARVLRKITADRRIIDEHRPVQPATTAYARGAEHSGYDFGCSICHQDSYDISPLGWCATIRLLAEAYDDRPGYRPEWRP